MNIKSAIADFGRGLSIIFSKPKTGEGDRKLAKMSMIVMAQIPFYGKISVSKQVIKGIESDLNRKAKKGGKDAVESMLENALRTPEYMRLLRKLDLGEPHLRIMAREALKNRDKGK